MTNHTHRFRAALLVKMAGICILFALYGCGGSDDPSPSTQFTLSGQVNRSGTFTRTDLQAFPPTTQSRAQCQAPLRSVALDLADRGQWRWRPDHESAGEK